MLKSRLVRGLKKGIENFLLVLAVNLLLLMAASPLNPELMFGLDFWLIFSFLIGFLYGFTYKSRWKALPSLVFWSIVIYSVMAWSPEVAGIYSGVYVRVNLSPLKWIVLTWASLSLLVDLVVDVMTK